MYYLYIWINKYMNYLKNLTACTVLANYMGCKVSKGNRNDVCKSKIFSKPWQNGEDLHLQQPHWCYMFISSNIFHCQYLHVGWPHTGVQVRCGGQVVLRQRLGRWQPMLRPWKAVTCPHCVAWVVGGSGSECPHTLRSSKQTARHRMVSVHRWEWPGSLWLLCLLKDCVIYE